MGEEDKETLFSQPPEFSGIAKAMKIEPEEWQRGKVSVAVTVSDLHTNKGGIAHGGLSSMMLDMALGGTLVSTLTTDQWCATTALNVNFIDAAQVGNRLTATGRIVRRGRNVAHLAGEVVDQGGRLIATATGTWAIWQSRPDKMPGRDA
jgi:uncharacterized protein (TIGR00369 family)